MQSTFDLSIVQDEKEEIVTVRLQQISPFKLADMMALCIEPSTSTYKTGTFVKECVKNEVIISPKNLVERIETCDEPFTAIKTVFNEVMDFTNNPKLYVAKKLDSEAKSDRKVEDMGDSVQQLD